MYLIYISYPIDIEERKTKRNAEMKESGSKFFIFVEECWQVFKANEYSDDCKSRACDQKCVFMNPRLVIKTRN